MEAALIKVAEWARYPNPDDLAFNEDDKKDVPKNIKPSSKSITKTSKTTPNKKATGQKEAKEEKLPECFVKLTPTSSLPKQSGSSSTSSREQLRRNLNNCF